MAQVDLTNAQYHIGTYSGIKQAYVGTSASSLTDSSGNSVATITDNAFTQDTDMYFARILQATFTVSGTEFYFYSSGLCWKVDNISYNVGDTLTLNIRADLVCQ